MNNFFIKKVLKVKLIHAWKRYLIEENFIAQKFLLEKIIAT